MCVFVCDIVSACMHLSVFFPISQHSGGALSTSTFPLEVLYNSTEMPREFPGAAAPLLHITQQQKNEE